MLMGEFGWVVHLVFGGIGMWMSLMVAIVLMQPMYTKMMRARRCESLWAYEDEPRECGGCGYDISYDENVGVCPECGWAKPIEGEVYQKRDVWLYWRKGNWRIEILETPWWSLLPILGGFVITLFAGVFVIAGMLYSSWGSVGGMVVACLMGVAVIAVPVGVFGINVWRVAVYMRERNKFD